MQCLDGSESGLPTHRRRQRFGRREKSPLTLVREQNDVVVICIRVSRVSATLRAELFEGWAHMLG